MATFAVRTHEITVRGFTVEADTMEEVMEKIKQQQHEQPITIEHVGPIVSRIDRDIKI